MVDQGVLPPEGHAAHVAFVLADGGTGRRLRGQVAAHVPGQMVAQEEGTTAPFARVRPQACVRSYVPSQFYGGREACLAVVAFVRFVGGVRGFVPLQAL